MGRWIIWALTEAHFYPPAFLEFLQVLFCYMTKTHPLHNEGGPKVANKVRLRLPECLTQYTSYSLVYSWLVLCRKKTPRNRLFELSPTLMLFPRGIADLCSVAGAQWAHCFWEELGLLLSTCNTATLQYTHSKLAMLQAHHVTEKGLPSTERS